MSYKLLSGVTLMAALAFGGFSAAAQTTQQDSSAQSVADAAKRARALKKNAGPSTKVITDDDVDNKNVKPGAEGLTVPTPQIETQPPSPEAVAAAEAADKKAEKSPADDPLKSTDNEKIAQMKKALALAEEDWKLSQRESALTQDSVYSNPDYARDTAGKAKLAELQQEINLKHDKVEELRTELAAMEGSASRRRTAPASADPPATAPQR
jgi:Tfp pilus assembly protein FimT